MNRYLVRPENPLALEANVLSASIRNIDERKSKIQELSFLTKNDPVYTEMENWLSDAVSDEKLEVIQNNQITTSLTGIHIVQMSKTQAIRMQRELPRVQIVQDGPLSLIGYLKSVLFSIKDTVTENDLWHLREIGLTAARRNGFSGTGEGVTVAVLDTGIDPHHIELKGKVSSVAYQFNTSNSGDWTHTEIQSYDTDGHGTHVAGLICGTTVGIAPNAQVINELMLPNRSGTRFNYAKAMEFAIDLAKENPNLRIVNMSAGMRAFVPQLLSDVQALLKAQILPVFAIGNSGRGINHCPGNFNEPLSVGATNKKQKIAGFSGGGRKLDNENNVYSLPDIVAPGEDVYSCKWKGGYEALSGTSMSTAIVSGIATLIIEKYPTIDVYDLIEELLSYCEKLRRYTNERQGHGLIRVREKLWN